MSLVKFNQVGHYSHNSICKSLDLIILNFILIYPFIWLIFILAFALFIIE